MGTGRWLLRDPVEEADRRGADTACDHADSDKMPFG